MEGYIKSLSTSWKHVFKRAIRPGGKIPLVELYESYGTKHNLEDGPAFIKWLKEVKLRGQVDSWEFSFMDDETPKDLKSNKKENNTAGITPEVYSRKEMTVDYIVNLPVRKAREILPSITDAKLLKYALQEARPRSGKDSLCRELEKRLKNLNVVSRV
jgi:hypothetical protein